MEELIGSIGFGFSDDESLRSDLRSFLFPFSSWKLLCLVQLGLLFSHVWAWSQKTHAHMHQPGTRIWWAHM